jgi:DHA2 family multidrug resistance protein
MTSYLLVRNSVAEQAALVEHITPYRQVVRDFAHHLSLATLSGRAALAQIVGAQAEAVAFIDNFKLMMYVSFLAIPLALLVQRPRGRLGNAVPASD